MTETFVIGSAGMTSPFRTEVVPALEDLALPVEPETAPPGQGLGREDRDEGAMQTSHESPTPRVPASGQSAIAVQAARQWDSVDRPAGWIGHVYGLVVHTTGGGLPASAKDQRIYHTVRAVDYYSQSHGCHYVNGWRGVAGGDLLQVANEREQANGVGVEDQRHSIEQGRLTTDLSAAVVAQWRARWPGVEHPLRLLPGTRTANSCYVHVECVPCVFHHDGRLITDAPPLRSGLRFTREQHEAVALLACDMARRNGWPVQETWWRTPRLLGHEDLTPYSRHDKAGGWDPGGMRAAPYFDWDFVYTMIEREVRGQSARAPAAGSTSSATEQEGDDEWTSEDEWESEDEAAAPFSEWEAALVEETENTEAPAEAERENDAGETTTPGSDEAEALEQEAVASAMLAEGESSLLGRLLRDTAARRAVITALDSGVRSEKDLTDSGYHVRHPARPAGPIQRSEPDFTELRDDWLDVRVRIVRPALADTLAQDKLSHLVPRGRPGSRPCCLVWTGVLDPGSLGSQGNASEKLGEVFTSKLGFIDLGHARETADATLWALNQLKAGGGKSGLAVALVSGTATLTVDVPVVRWLALSQQLAYVDSVAHEIETFGVAGPGMDNSSFSPEDLTSNLFGTVVAAAALEAGGGSNGAITSELKRMLTAVGAQPASVGRAAQAVAEQRGWWQASGATVMFPLGKRNLTAVPWLIDVQGHSARAQPSPLLVAPPLTGPEFTYESSWTVAKNADFQTKITAIAASLPASAMTP